MPSLLLWLLLLGFGAASPRPLPVAVAWLTVHHEAPAAAQRFKVQVDTGSSVTWVAGKGAKLRSINRHGGGGAVRREYEVLCWWGWKLRGPHSEDGGGKTTAHSGGTFRGTFVG